MQVIVSVDAPFARLAFPNQGGLVATPCFQVTVQAVVGGVELAAEKPFVKGRLPLADLVPILEPLDLAGARRPERLWIASRFLVNRGIFQGRLTGKIGGRRESSVFIEECGNRCV